MREKIVKILFTPIPGTKSIEQGLFRVICMSSTKSRQWSVSSLIFLLKSLRWFVPSVSVLLAIWMIGGNFLASQQEKEIEQDIDEFVERFPDTEPNDSALKLRALMAKLGISGGGTPEFPIDAYTRSHPDFTISESDRQAFEEIREELGDYLNAQISKPNDNVDPIPDKLRQYLMNNQEKLEAIRQHILNNEVPQWERDMTPIVESDYTFGFPSHLNLINLQKVILLDVLEKNSRGQLKQAEEMLEVSWRLNQSLRNDYYLISQLVVLIMGRYSTGVIRKLEYLPVEWQQRLLEHDYHQSVLISLETDFLFEFNFMRSSPLYLPLVYSTEEVFSPEDLLLAFLIKFPIFKPYRRFSAIDTYNIQIKRLAESKQQNICLSDSAASATIDTTPAWWNIPGQTIVPARFNGHHRATHYMLDLELTQKILQVKAIAAKTGKWPQSVPNMESKICPGVEWVYQVSPDGTMSISLSEQPEWLTERIENQNALPLTYSTRRIPDYEQSLN
ncbi:hypothetical protein MC7420_1201 [Coleofasciculus chthonoplastes PCC 7420]|uniref:Uncharacterized protein n=1 Tax=Coleofasciculus chthonoplastes PCC 7420 TaxID=118168 RepID=B4VXD7_9CYAN|nr:hypothetical protein [Coleofasciculus chthonoplastes]EDX73405.1 hypothetical protein MC7420_1201 [Coleofasciculus chthonoplastes PCC 7420]